ncbi:hypothetical protein [Schleiferilactobacillus perolens]|jgi:hypothetical protein|nr:hypothetical protein [Schleiferilactobacillus perolens]MCI1913079.1 hypothetical protein [Schleiferilactobacillus harbinensis]MCI2172468.1 hypothetical protein [Schleiferilactobacillus perolens]
MTTDPTLSPAVETLLKEVRDHFPNQLNIQVDDQESGRISHESAQQEPQQDGSILLHVYDKTDINYTISHELLHIEMYLKGFPTMSFPLTTTDPRLDDQLGATAVSIYNSALHLIIGAEQRRNGIITKDTVQAFIRGISDVVPAEEGDAEDPKIIYRVLSLLDGLAFFADHEDEVPAEWLQMYPIAFQAAQQLYAVMTEKVIDSPFAIRRSIVKTLRAFDAWLDKLGYVPMPHDQFAAVSPVLSKRQLKLEFRQVFDILHSDYLNRQTKEKAFLAIGKNDRQLAFAIPEKELDQDHALAVYGQTTADVLEHYGISYTTR